MFPIERRKKIILNLEENGSITVEDLAKKLEVTPTTIRRDLKYLEDHDKITRTFGGAVVKTELIDEIDFSLKATAFNDEKKRIATAAATLIDNGTTIILDAGTTNLEIAKALMEDKKTVNVVTNDILIAIALLNAPTIDVFCTGGHLQKHIGACLGETARNFFETINVDIAFIGTSAVDIDRGISSPTMEKAIVKKQIIKCATKRILVTDSSKFENVSFVKICNLEKFDHIITDTNLPLEYEEALLEKNISLTKA